MLIRITLIILITLFSNISFSQAFFRIKADFSIKAKGFNGKSQLTMGKVYYDKTIKKIVYKIKYPEKSDWVSVDTNMYHIVNNKVTSRKSLPAIVEFTIFHIALSGNLSNYGLDKSPFTISKVQQSKGMVITTWDPPQLYSKIYGRIIVSNKNKKLYGIIFFSPDGMILRKQFFKKYQNINGFSFPSEVLQISYNESKESYELSSFKNIIINDMNEDYIYDYYIKK